MPMTATEPRIDLSTRGRIHEPARWVPRQAHAHPRRCSPRLTDRLSGERSAMGSELAVRQERARIARELHDGVAQTLYAITLVAAHALELREVSQADQFGPLLAHVRQLADTAQLEVRALLGNLWTDEPSADGLTQALIGLGEAHQTSHGIPVRLALGPEPQLPAATSDALVRIAREALANVARHAHATHIDLVLEASAGELALLIADDGHGFDPAVPRPGHFGLRSMRERAEAVGGTLEVTSAAGRGARIEVRVPCDGH